MNRDQAGNTSDNEATLSAGERGTWVQSSGLEDPLEEEMATHSGILARRIPWAEEPGEMQSMGRRVDMTEVT